LDAASARHVAKEAVMAKQFATQQDRPAPEQAQPHAPVVRRAEAAPLVVGHAADAAERDADRVADEVIARLQGADAHVHAAGCGHDAPLARSFGPSTAPEVGYEGGELSDGLSGRIEGARGGGRPLDEPVRRRMEGAFGHSLAGVRIHTGGEAADLNRSISARAFTTGNDVFFGAGQYQPDTAEGERMLAHELAHTQQQGGAARRIHRAWDIAAPAWAKTHSIKTLPSRPIWFVEDVDGDVMVVKTEDQPVGLGSLIGEMHVRATEISSVKQAKLSNTDRVQLSTKIGDPAISSDMKWDDYGRSVLATNGPASAEPEDNNPWLVGVRDAAEKARNAPGNMIAMTKATGEEAGDRAKPAQGKGADADDRSDIRRLLMDRAHMRMIGRMTAVDLFMGNQDRGMTGNVGNWFLDPQDKITVIDHVDPGGGPRTGTVGLLDYNTWVGEMGEMLKKNKLANTARDTVFAVLGRLEGYGDDNLFDWAAARAQGAPKPRRDQMVESVRAGMEDGLKELTKIFGTTKWSIGKGGLHDKKKAIRNAAQAASAVDAGDARFGGNGAPNYYNLLKQRIEWLNKAWKK
jgi:hypothetical protein